VRGKENQHFAERIKALKTNYPVERYQRERELTEKYISIRSKFPRQLSRRTIYNRVLVELK